VIWFFIFCDFCKSVIISISPSYSILNLADVADVSLLRILFRRMLPVMHLTVLTSVVLSRRLVMVVSALVSMA